MRVYARESMRTRDARACERGMRIRDRASRDAHLCKAYALKPRARSSGDDEGARTCSRESPSTRSREAQWREARARRGARRAVGG